MRHRLPAIVAVIVALVCGGCNRPAETYFTSVEFFVNDGSSRDRLLDDVGGAEDRIDAAFSRLTDDELAQALVDAKKRGATVRVVGDEDSRNDSGFQLLLDNDVDVVFGDGTFRYLPDPTFGSLVDNCGIVDDGDRVLCQDDTQGLPQDAVKLDPGALERPGSFSLMSHNFVILEKRTVWDLAAPLAGEKTYPGGLRAESERMREVFEREFQQMHGGVFSTTLDVYNGPLKSTVEHNPEFPTEGFLTDRGEIRVRFNPQDRLTKTVIDETYRARSSVWIMTDNLGEEFLIDALKYKAKYDFDVRLIVNRDHLTEVTRADVEALDFVRFAPDDVDYVPTIAIFEAAGKDRLGNLHPRRVQVLSHPLWRTGPYKVTTSEPADVVEEFPADYFVDGSMWSLLEYQGQINEVKEIDDFVDLYDKVWSKSTKP